MQVDGQTAVVTGGASGLGAETARWRARAGAKVGLLDLDMDRARGLAEEIGGLAVACDVADAAGAEAAVAEARAAHGPARVLINCAGIGGARRILGRDGPMPLADFAKIVEVNLIGSFNLMRLVAAEMIGTEPLADGERGVIISTASVAAFEGQVGQAAYSASKGGIVALTMPAAREFARWGVRVLAIAPGLFDTPMLRRLPKEAQESLGAQVPFPNRLGKSSEYAALAMQMIENPMLNAEVVRLDGAIRMQPR